MVALGIIGAIIWLLVWITTMSQPTYGVGAATVTDPALTVSLTNSQANLTASRYDTFESPRGTDYVVPAGQTLYITLLVGRPDTDATLNQIEIGYGDDGVANSITAPTTPVVVFAASWEATETDLPRFTNLTIPIPAGKYPYLWANQSSNVQALGIAR